MRLEIKKFGKILNSRSAGKEAVLRVKQIVNGYKDINEIVLDFNGVEIMSPSFADEFVNGIKREYEDREIKIENAESNPVISDVLSRLDLL